MSALEFTISVGFSNVVLGIAAPIRITVALAVSLLLENVRVPCIDENIRGTPTITENR